MAAGASTKKPRTRRLRSRDEAESPQRQSAAVRLVRLLVLALLITIVAGPSLLPKYSVVDNDLWWHLKVGDWIREHVSFPHTGILSRTAADRPWMAYSWLYEILLSFSHSRLHLAGIAVYGWLLALAVTYSVFWMTRRLSGTFWRTCLLATITCAAFLFNVYPRPVFFSMALFTTTLTLLLEARRTGRPQLLYWLPPLFILWANAHIQFIYGVLLVGLFVVVSLLQEAASRSGFAQNLLPQSTLPARTLVIILGACLLATCIGPYSYHLYSVAFGYAEAKFPYGYINELQPPNFRRYVDFVQLFLTGFAFFSLGRRKQLDLFMLALLIGASVLGFRTHRDAWVICLPAAACLAEAFASEQRVPAESLVEKAGLAVAVVALIVLYARLVQFNTPNLRLAVARVFPVQAINFLHAHPQPGPLYNTFDWGGFIAWYLPEYPVAIDGRTDLYGDETDTRFIMTEYADPSYTEDPYLNESKLLLLPKQEPLTRILSADSRFTVIYEDDLAVLLARR